MTENFRINHLTSWNSTLLETFIESLDGIDLFKVTLLSALMSTESRFAEIFLSRNLSIALEQFVDRNSVKSILNKIVCFHDFGEGSFRNISLGSEEIHFQLR